MYMILETGTVLLYYVSRPPITTSQFHVSQSTVAILQPLQNILYLLVKF